MFGSSQDRARQLAGRMRKGRVSSGGLHSGHHPVGSLTQVSQQSHISASPEHHIQRPPVVPELPSPGFGLIHSGLQNLGGSGTTQQLKDEQIFPAISDISPTTSGRLPSQTEQHRLQAEYLSQVLYNSLTLSAPGSPPHSQFRISSRHNRYGSLGMPSATSHQLRNMTAPMPSTQQFPILQAQSDLTMLPSFQECGFENQFRTSTTVSLRGGAGDGDVPSYPDRVGKNEKTNETNAFQDLILKGLFPAHFETAQRFPSLGQHTSRTFNPSAGTPPPGPYWRFEGIPRSGQHISRALKSSTSTPPVQVVWKTQMAKARSTPNLGQQQNRLPLWGRHLYYSGSAGSSAASPAAKATLNKLFDKYREAGATDPDIVGVEGTMKYFQHTDVDVEGLESLAALEVVQAPTMGEMSREGFVNGWQEKNCDTVDKQKAFIKNLKRELPGNKDLYTRIYKFTFTIARAQGQKAVTLDAAIAYWELLFSSPLSAVKWTSSNTPWLTWWTEFLTSSWKKSVNKDMWNETLKFAQLTLSDEDMSFWNEESSWPSVIDEFVEWVKNEKRGGSREEVMEEDY